MTALALRGSRYLNGVSRIHGGVSRACCATPGRSSPDEIPLGYVTNGVHLPTFLRPRWREVLDRFLGVGWRTGSASPASGSSSRAIPTTCSGACAATSRRSLFDMVRHRVARAARNRGERGATSSAADARRPGATRTC